MKKRVIFVSAIVLALMALPAGSMDVCAEEGTAAEESRAASSKGISIKAPYDLHLSESLDRCAFKYSTQSGIYGEFSTHLQIYRDDELVGEYQALGDNSSPGSMFFSEEQAGTRYYEINIPLYQCDMKGWESGSYRLEAWMEKWWSDGSLISSEKVTSNTVTYTRPEQALGVTKGYWDTETEGLFHFTSVAGAAGYEFRLYKQDENSGEWKACILVSPNDGLLSTPGHFSIYSNITADSPKDAGGESRTRDFSKDIFGNNYNKPAGKYCVTVRALSGNLGEAVNGAEGEKSDALEIAGSNNSSEASGQSDNSGSDWSSYTEKQISAAAPGSVVRMQDVTTLSNADMKLLLKQGVTLEMEYTYEDVNYKVRIPAGAAVDNDIQWYGPLYLAKYYGVDTLGSLGSSADSYTVQAGDTLGRIARANNMTVSELAALNPQIKNVNVIIPGQVIKTR